MAKKWNEFDELPEMGQRVEVKFPGGIVTGIYDGVDMKFPNADMGVDALLQSGEKWRQAPEEKNQDEKTLNDAKTIPNDLLLRWITEKILEEFGTIANELEINTDKLICRYNAGVVTK